MVFASLFTGIVDRTTLQLEQMRERMKESLTNKRIKSHMNKVIHVQI